VQITPITKVSGIRLQLNFEEMVMLRAVLRRARPENPASANDYGQESRGQSNRTFLRDLHESLIDMTGDQNELQA
jgi:hypothetical protein